MLIFWGFVIPDISIYICIYCTHPTQVYGHEHNCMTIVNHQRGHTLINRIVFTGYPPFRKYIVLGIRNDLNVKSKMPGSKMFASFEERLFAAHGIRVKNTEAPMLEVCLKWPHVMSFHVTGCKRSYQVRSYFIINVQSNVAMCYIPSKDMMIFTEPKQSKTKQHISLWCYIVRVSGDSMQLWCVYQRQHWWLLTPPSWTLLGTYICIHPYITTSSHHHTHNHAQLKTHHHTSPHITTYNYRLSHYPTTFFFFPSSCPSMSKPFSYTREHRDSDNNTTSAIMSSHIHSTLMLTTRLLMWCHWLSLPRLHIVDSIMNASSSLGLWILCHVALYECDMKMLCRVMFRRTRMWCFS